MVFCVVSYSDKKGYRVGNLFCLSFHINVMILNYLTAFTTASKAAG